MVGILIGAGATYFHASAAVKSADAVANEARKATESAVRSEQQAKAGLEFWTRTATRLAAEMDQAHWDRVAEDIPDLKVIRRT